MKSRELKGAHHPGVWSEARTQYMKEYCSQAAEKLSTHKGSWQAVRYALVVPLHYLDEPGFYAFLRRKYGAKFVRVDEIEGTGSTLITADLYKQWNIDGRGRQK